jgi:predicted esterase
LKQPADTGGARLESRPQPPVRQGRRGLSLLPMDGERDALLYVPPAADPAVPAPLLMLLHGAGGHAHRALGLLRQVPEAGSGILLAPASSGFSWDVVIDEYGADVARIDRALRRVFEGYRIEPGRVGIGGFSDGASYALSLGLTNGDLFSHVIAFSPGFAAPTSRSGSPRIFVAHGAADQVLPVAACSRRIVERLRGGGLDVRYHEFEGGHMVPPEVAREALRWFLA